MRSDMFEIIIERPRWYGGPKKGNRAKEHARRDPEHAPTREPISRSRGTKSLNENLAPLKRFLARRVGRPWNQVYAEVSAHIAVRSAVQKHVVDHLRQFVRTDVVIIDGQPHEPVARGSARAHYLPISLYHRTFYVCPRTGILRATPQVSRKKKRSAPRPDIHPIDDDHHAHRIDGAWYHVTFAPIPLDYLARETCYDVVLRAWVSDRWMGGCHGFLERTHGRSGQYAVAKRSLSARELRDLGITR